MLNVRAGMIILICVVWMSLSFAWGQTPELEAPTDPLHPGSEIYPYRYSVNHFSCHGKTGTLFLPRNRGEESKKFSVLVFGHGQALSLRYYKKSFAHFAGKGLAVIFPDYDHSFFDQNWRKMARDYVEIADCALRENPDLNQENVIFSGHSKGAYVALLASTVGPPVSPGSVLLFAPAGYDPEWIQKMNPQVPLSIFYGERDQIIKPNLIREIFEKSSSRHKQLITLRSFDRNNVKLPADHFYLLSENFFGKKWVGPFHFYGFWSWILGAAWDLKSGGHLKNPYLYGDKALSDGFEPGVHLRERNSDF